MKTKLKQIHEEQYSDNSRCIGVILNYSITCDWKESFVFVYRDNVYIIFNTIIELIDYLLYAEKKMNRAYINESDFDDLFDSEYIDDKFTNKLKWVSN